MQQGKKYQCPECPYATHQRSALQMHLNIHPGQRLCCPEEPNMPENDDAEDSARKYSNDTANERKEPEVLDLRYPKDATKESEDPMDLCVRTKKPEDLDQFNEVETNLEEKPTCSKEKSLPSTAESPAVASPSSSKRPRKRQETIYRCEEPLCSYSTFIEGHLNRHRLTHTKEKPFSCTHCTKKFALKWNLLEHFKRLHEELPIPQELLVREKVLYRCPLCGRNFSYKKSFLKHCHTTN